MWEALLFTTIEGYRVNIGKIYRLLDFTLIMSGIKQSVCLACLCLHDTLGLSCSCWLSFVNLPYGARCKKAMLLQSSPLPATLYGFNHSDCGDCFTWENGFVRMGTFLTAAVRCSAVFLSHTTSSALCWNVGDVL